MTGIKPMLVLAGLLMISFGLKAQPDPVKWENSVKKINANTYEVHLKATVEAPWHMFSQVQPKDAIPMPTELKFVKNPLISLVGKAKEVGKKEIHKDPVIGFIDHRYAGTLEFVQVVTLKGSASTNVAGSVTYQVCTDEQCLPSKTINFSLKLE